MGLLRRELQKEHAPQDVAAREAPHGQRLTVDWPALSQEEAERKQIRSASKPTFKAVKLINGGSRAAAGMTDPGGSLAASATRSHDARGIKARAEARVGQSTIASGVHATSRARRPAKIWAKSVMFEDHKTSREKASGVEARSARMVAGSGRG